MLDPRAHTVIIRSTGRGQRGITPDGVGTLLVSPTPFTPADLDALDAESSRLGFKVVFSPRVSADRTFDALAASQHLRAFTDTFPINIAAPTDDSPFFFNMLRLRDIFDVSLLRAGKSSQNMAAVFVLGALLVAVIGLTALCIVLPLWFAADRGATIGAAPLLVFFAAIGTGFMMVETSQMQRLIIVLGHPTYGLSVVLFALLLSSGLGSMLTSGISADTVSRAGLVRLGLLLTVLIVVGSFTGAVTRGFEASTTSVRILASLGVLFPMGVFMGMAFPLGMKLASRRAAALTPWLWGINGAFSVLASVLAVAVALTWAISAAYWTGCAAYAVALAAFVQAARRA